MDLDEMRGWIADCGGDADDLTDERVRQIVDRNYLGGVDGFVRDQNPGKG